MFGGRTVHCATGVYRKKVVAAIGCEEVPAG